LYAGTPVDRATFEFYAGLLNEWGAPAPPAADIQRTESGLAVWQLRRTGSLPPHGRRVLRGGTSPVLAIWATAPDGVLARLILPGEFDKELGPLWTTQHLVASFFDLEGKRFLGQDPGDAVSLTADETRLPFVVRVGFAPDWRDDGASTSRRRLFAIGLTLTLVLMLGAAYGLSRATSREMALVRQQSDFIAAVSHEFRTPLTSMRHLTELLASHNVRDETRKATYYELLARETERLHRMVESLLSYGRMQAGAYAWRREPTRMDELVREVVDGFRDDSRAVGRRIECACDAGLPLVEADREALTRAVFNLLENAAKYSEAGRPIRVSIRRSERGVEVAVEDHGVGIPHDEQRRLFDRFVRGTQATRAGIGGIGIGLALVKSVAEAHGGAVRLVSEVGRGSTFAIDLPTEAATPSAADVPRSSHVPHPHR